MAIDLAYLQNVLNLTFRNVIADNLNQRTILLKRIRKTRGGGKNIAFDVKVARGTSAGSYASGANITGDDNDIEVPAVLQWKRVKAEFKVTGDALAAAMSSTGPEAFSKLFTKQIMDATKNLAKNLNFQIYGDGTGNTGLDVDGLGALIANTGTYAGINRATYAPWRSNVLANGGTPRALTVDLLRQLNRAIFVASGFEPDFIITDPITYDKYAALFDPIKRVIVGDEKPMDLGTRDLAFEGVPVIRDPDCPAGKLYMLTQDELEFQQLPVVMDGPMEDGQPDGDAELESGDGEVGIEAGIELLGKVGDAYRGFIKVYGNMVSEHPNQQGVIADIDVS